MDGNDQLFFKSVMGKNTSHTMTWFCESQSLSSSVSGRARPRDPGETYACAAHPPETSPGTPEKLLALAQERRFQGRRREDQASSCSPRTRHMVDGCNQEQGVSLNWRTLLAQEQWRYVLYSKGDEPGTWLHRTGRYPVCSASFLLWHLEVEQRKKILHQPVIVVDHYTFTTFLQHV